jgi:glycosyltransferase involved in cell wall biosynthesis
VTILGIFLNREIRTGANRRYLELLEELARRGNRVWVIMNSLLEYRAAAFTPVYLTVDYRPRSLPPASALFRRAVRQNIRRIEEALAYGFPPGGAAPEPPARNRTRSVRIKNVARRSAAFATVSSHQRDRFSDHSARPEGRKAPRTSRHGGPDWIHIHSDMNLPCALFLKSFFRSPSGAGTKLFFAYRSNEIRRSKILREKAGLPLKELLFSFVYNRVTGKRERLNARFAELITFQNSADRDDFVDRTGADRGKTLIIPGSIGPPRFGAEWKNRNASESPRNLLYVGELTAAKGLPVLLEALALLKGQGYGGLTLKALGSTGDREYLEGRIRSLGLTGQVSLEGFQAPFPYLAEAGLLVYPSFYDAFPDTILEALHAGCPVLAAAAGGIPELLEYGELLFPPGDAAALAAAIRRVLDSPEQYRRLRELCGKRAEQFYFDWAAAFEGAMADYGKEP